MTRKRRNGEVNAPAGTRPSTDAPAGKRPFNTRPSKKPVPTTTSNGHKPQEGFAAPEDALSSDNVVNASVDTAPSPRFEELLGRVAAVLVDTITNDFHFEHMTPIQSATIGMSLQGSDVLAQARTGTGKTLAFLVPSVHKMFRQPLKSGNAPQISLLVVSPTRELALQIATEANNLLRRVSAIKVATAFGGTDKAKEAKKLFGCNILVATPGRLLDHLSDDEMRYQLSAVQTLVLDEADRMLDMGFLPDVKKIISHLPPKDKVPRQSMLFSATIPKEIHGVAGLLLNSGYETVSTIPKGEANTHERVNQYLVTVPEMKDLAPATVALIKSELATTPTFFKAILFAPTAQQVNFHGHILTQASGIPNVSLLHSRMSQSKRLKVAAEFKDAKTAICVATDVIARGMDFPNVTHVIQCGLPMGRDPYIHRLGRTARAEADGRGVLVLADAEKGFLRQLKDIKLQEYPTPLVYSMSDIQPALNTFDGKQQVYQAYLGYYKTFTKVMGWSTADLVAEANKFALQGLGCPEVPALEKKTIGKMGLKGVKGLVIMPNAPRQNEPRRRGGGEGRRPANAVNGAA